MWSLKTLLVKIILNFIHQYYCFWKHCLIPTFASCKCLSILCWSFAAWTFQLAWGIQLAWGSLQTFIKSRKIFSITLNLMSLELVMQPLYCCWMEKLRMQWMLFWVSWGFWAPFSGAQFFLIMLPGTARSHFSLW